MTSSRLAIWVASGCNIDKKIGLDDLKTFTSLSPTLVTPALGTPASGVATNITGLPLTTGVTGTLPVANGGTGVTTSTGTGNTVLSSSPTLVTPALGTPASGVMTNMTGLPVAGLANGTDGELITWSACAVAATVAVGTVGQVLTSGGVGVAPTFQAAAGGGCGWTVITKATDETICTDTTLTADSTLKFCADACSCYAIIVFPVFNSEATPDYKFSYSIPTNASTAGFGDNFDQINLNTKVWTSTVVAAVSNTCPWFIYHVGRLKTGACAGEFSYNWAQNVSSATCTTTEQGSWMAFKKR